MKQPAQSHDRIDESEWSPCMRRRFRLQVLKHLISYAMEVGVGQGLHVSGSLVDNDIDGLVDALTRLQKSEHLPRYQRIRVRRRHLEAGG